LHALHQEFFLDPDFECALDVIYCDVSYSQRDTIWNVPVSWTLSAGSDVRRRQSIRPLEILSSEPGNVGRTYQNRQLNRYEG